MIISWIILYNLSIFLIIRIYINFTFFLINRTIINKNIIIPEIFCLIVKIIILISIFIYTLSKTIFYFFIIILLRWKIFFILLSIYRIKLSSILTNSLFFLYLFFFKFITILSWILFIFSREKFLVVKILLNILLLILGSIW